MNKKMNSRDIKMGMIARHVKIALLIATLCFGIGVVTAIPQQPYTLYGTATLNGKILTAQDDDVVSLKVDGIELVSYTMGDISGTDNYVLKVPMDSDLSVTTAAQEGDNALIYINGIAINEGVQIIGAPSTTVQFDISATSAENPPSVTLRYPNGGESIIIGTQVQLSAHATDDAAVTGVTFYYSSDGGSNWNLIGEGVKVSGIDKDGIWNRTWNTDGLSAGTNYMIKAVASDGASTSEDQSDGTFSLTSSNVIYVPDDYLTIQAGVDAASPGNTIIVRDGTYTENVVVNKTHLTVRSENGAGATIVQAANSSNPVFEITMDNVSIRGFTVKGTFSYVLSFGGDSFGAVLVRKGGIELKGSKSCNISNNICAHNSIGIYVMDSTNNMITENRCSDNEEAGISLSHSNNNSVVRNECTVGVSCGILLEASKNNTISENKCSENQNGIMVYSPQSSESNLAANNIIIRNRLSDNEGGITLYVSYNNTITENNISNNDYGIILDWSNNDIIYLNNLNNEINVKFGSYGYDPSTDIWNSTSKITYTYNGTTYTNYLGNYWNDYNGDDVNKDGIGGIPYLLDQDKDNYPLMGPFKDNTIIPAPLTVMAGPDQTVNEGDTVCFAGGVNGPNTERYAMDWDFGDANIETGTLTPIHVYADNGVYTVTLTVTDPEGSVETDTLTVTVNNVAPTVNAGSNQTVGAGGTVTFSGSFTDPGTNDTHSIKWSFGDGGSASGTLTPTHTYIYSGTYAATLIVTDDDGARGIGTLTVNIGSLG